MGVSLDKITPGLSALLDAVAEEGPGRKFITVRHVVEWSCLDESAEVLYGGKAAGFLWGRFSRAEFMLVAGIVDGALNRGAGHFAVVTEHPAQPGGRADVPHLTVTRYKVEREHGVRHVARWTREEYGAYPEAFEDAERDRVKKDEAHMERVSDILRKRREVRERARAAAGLACAGGGAGA